jgi:hypothetical protein
MRKSNYLLFAAILFISTFKTLNAATTEWAKSFGGTADENFSISAKDANGNLFVATKFIGTCDFDPNPFVSKTLTANAFSVAISKFDGLGKLLWVKGISCPQSDIKGMTIDNDGNIIFSGFFSTNFEGTATSDFNPEPTQATALLPGYMYSDFEKRNIYFNDGFVCKWDNDGNFIWVKQFGGPLNEEVNELKTDASNNIILVGTFYGFAGVTVDCNPDATAEYLLKTNTDYSAQFITKLDAAGNFIWASKIDGDGNHFITDIDVDNTNNLYFSGYFGNTIDANPGDGVFTLTSQTLDSDGGKADAFILKLDENGNFIMAKSFGNTTWSDYLNGIVVDKQTGEMYVGGYFYGPMNIGNIAITSAGNYDPFIAKLDATGNCLWAKNWGGANYDTFTGMDRDVAGNIFTTGLFSKTADMNPAAEVMSFTSVGNYDAFINKFDNAGNLLWAKQIGGMGNDWGNSVTALGDGNVFAVGSFSFTAEVGSSATTLESAGLYDVWMYKSGSTTDLKNNRFEANISMFPNPTQGQTVIDLKQSFSQITVNVRNVLGATLSSQKFIDVSKINLNLQGESGLYFVELNDNNGQSTTLKVIKR